MTIALFPAGVLGLALAMLAAHRRAWRAAQARVLDAADRAYRLNQFRRRMKSSTLLALLAPPILVGQLIVPSESPVMFVAIWLGVALMTLWIGLLAVVDTVASGRHFRRLHHEQQVARARLKIEVDRLLAEQTRVPKAGD
ncbi:MAG: hypothetical protein HYX69_16025 [Planctomycetia bacterium]|nr:hypothetical protein [Planctomycetia bacterium]